MRWGKKGGRGKGRGGGGGYGIGVTGWLCVVLGGGGRELFKKYYFTIFLSCMTLDRIAFLIGAYEIFLEIRLPLL